MCVYMYRERGSERFVFITVCVCTCDKIPKHKDNPQALLKVHSSNKFKCLLSKIRVFHSNLTYLSLKGSTIVLSSFI